MERIKEHLVWLDKNWRGRGYARNVHLYVDHENKTYECITTYTYLGSGIEVKTKHDISEYINLLKNNWYKEITKD